MELLTSLFIEIMGVLGEFILQILFQVFLEMGSHIFLPSLKSLEEKFPKAPAAAYLFLGLGSGLLSLLFLPGSLLKDPQLRWLNLFLAPFIVGFIMEKMGKWRREKGQETLKINPFFAGFVLALSFAVVRFVLAK